MSLETWLIYLAVGRLITWLLQVNGLMRPVWSWRPLLGELGQCDLCLGFWIYLGLSFALTANGFLIFPWWLDRVILSAFTSLMAHLLRIGYQTKFGVTVIE